MPAPPQPQAAAPSHGIAGWLSHTQKLSWQTVHVMFIVTVPLRRRLL
jgi:hypothetical protein